MPKYEMVRIITIRETVAIRADNMNEAIEMAEDDFGDIMVIQESNAGYDVDYTTIKKCEEK